MFALISDVYLYNMQIVGTRSNNVFMYILVVCIVLDLVLDDAKSRR